MDLSTGKLNDLLRTPQTIKDLHLCTRFDLLGDPADATVAVISLPVATAHHLIDYTAVGGGKKTLEQAN